MRRLPGARRGRQFLGVRRNDASSNLEEDRSRSGRDRIPSRYDELVALFSEVEDAKTGQKFFRRKAWNLYKVTRDKHMAKGCLSDMYFSTSN